MACFYTDWSVDFFSPQISQKEIDLKSSGRDCTKYFKSKSEANQKISGLQATCGVSFLLPFKYVLLQLTQSHVILHKRQLAWNANYISFIYRMIQIWALVQWSRKLVNVIWKVNCNNLKTLNVPNIFVIYLEL